MEECGWFVGAAASASDFLTWNLSMSPGILDGYARCDFGFSVWPTDVCALDACERAGETNGVWCALPGAAGIDVVPVEYRPRC